MPSENSNVAIAMALVVGAGGATAVGAAIVFVPSLVQYANRKTLAASLGLSAGVMTYVSFVEIFRKSVNSFQLVDGYSADDAYVCATLCFFGGVLLMVLLNHYVTKLVHFASRPKRCAQASAAAADVGSDLEADTEQPEETTFRSIHEYLRATAALDDMVFACCSDDPVEDLETMKYMAAQLEKEKKRKRAKKEQKEQAPMDESDNACIDEECSADGCHRDEEAMAKKRDDVKLMRMSVTTAIAIALHNFPEGLATFVAALHDPKVGAVLALAIAIHNIPEGLCVALPIYYATGSRWKAFGLALCSGASEPLAALLGWAVLANTLNDTMYAILFGIVGGMMVIISVRELLPTAHRYDPDDSVVTNSYIAGMCIMALSLVLFLV